MNTRYFKRVHSELDPVSGKFSYEPINLWRLIGMVGGLYRGNGIWEVDNDNYLYEMVVLMMSGWDNYIEITEEKAEEIAKQRFPDDVLGIKGK